MYCRNCGCKIDGDDKFCSACGQAQVHKGENAITSYNIENNNNVNQTSMQIRTKKNKRKKYIILLLLIAMVIIVFRSGIISQDFVRFVLKEFPEGVAIASEEEKLLGNWKGEDEGGEIGYIKFKKDHKFEITYPKKNRSMSGIYLIADASTINFYPTKVDGEIPEERIEIKDKFYFENENTLVMKHQGVSAILIKTAPKNVENSTHVEIDNAEKTTVVKNKSTIKQKNKEITLEQAAVILKEKYDAEAQYFYFSNDEFDKLDKCNKTVRDDYYKFRYFIDESEADFLLCVNKYTQEIIIYYVDGTIENIDETSITNNIEYNLTVEQAEQKVKDILETPGNTKRMYTYNGIKTINNKKYYYISTITETYHGAIECLVDIQTAEVYQKDFRNDEIIDTLN